MVDPTIRERLRAALAAWLDSHGEAEIEEVLADAAKAWLEEQTPVLSETAWLIERGQPEGLAQPEWWSVSDGYPEGRTWTRDAWRAVRYPTRAEAESAIFEYGIVPGHPFEAHVIEHGFVNGMDGAIAESMERNAARARIAEVQRRQREGSGDVTAVMVSPTPLDELIRDAIHDNWPADISHIPACNDLQVAVSEALRARLAIDPSAAESPVTGEDRG